MYYYKKIVIRIFLFFLFIILISNIIDASASNRNIAGQINLEVILRSLFNSVIYLGTPYDLKAKIYKSPIIIPDKSVFPNVEKLRKSLKMLNLEATRALEYSKPIKNDLFFTDIADKGWKRFYVKWYGPIDPLARKICPFTCKLIESMPEVHLAMFSILLPGSKIPPHFGPARMCLRYHMGIDTPNDPNCYIKIGNTKYSWEDGKDVMFDDTFLHEVVNNTDKIRIILFLDVERPQFHKIFETFNKKMISIAGPITTRSNETKEKIIKL